MQATMTSKRPGFDRISGSLMALGIVAGIAIGAAGQAVIDDSGSATRSVPAAVDLKAYTSAGQGDGRVGGAHTMTEPLKGYTSDSQGEGLLNSDLRLAAPVVSLDTTRFLEQNLYLPDAPAADATQRMIYERLLDENLDYPSAVSDSALNWRLLEQNSWGEDFTYDTPDGATGSPDVEEVQPHSGEVIR